MKTAFLMRRILLLLLFAGLIVSAYAETHWRQVAQPTTKDLLRLSFVDSARGWVCGREGVMFTTTNGGTVWTQQTTGVTGDFIDIFMLDERFGWALSWAYYTDTLTYYGTYIVRTTNGGVDWSADEYPVLGKYFHAISFFDSLNGWMVGEEGDIEKTMDGGHSWTRAQVDTTELSFMPILNIRFFSKDIGFGMGGALDFAGVLWRTTNAGENWSVLNVSPEPVYEIHFVDSTNFIGIAGDFDFGASMIRTSDAGRTWEYIYLAIFGQPRAMSFRTPNEAWVPVGNTLMATYDTARTWTIVDTLGWRIPYHLAFTDSLTGYLVTDSGFVYKYRKTTVTVAEKGQHFPRTLRLAQNYPNPFNPATTIQFSVPVKPRNATRVTLRVYDLLGREIKTLVDDTREPGDYSVVWDARDVPTGIYLCKLSAGGLVDTKKMVFIR